MCVVLTDFFQHQQSLFSMVSRALKVLIVSSLGSKTQTLFSPEIFKANSAILNTLLTILNERQFDNGAGERVDCPLKCVIGASNELPESEELDALLDRFLLRAQVLQVSDDGLLKLLSSSQPNEVELRSDERNYSDDLNEIHSTVINSLSSIALDQNIAILIKDIRSFVTDTLGQYVSDRRLVKAARLLRVSAATHGRQQVDLIDVLLLQHILWTYPHQRDALREFIVDHLTPNDDIVGQSNFLLKGLANEALVMVKKTMGDVTGEAGARDVDVDAIKSIAIEVGEIKRLLDQQGRALERHITLLQNLDTNLLFITPDEAHSVQQHCLPLAVAVSESVAKVCDNAAALTLALSGVIDDDLRSSVIEFLFMDTNEQNEPIFSDEDLELSLKEAKKLFNGEDLKQWKKARKNIE